jgi:hypothetical protein
MATWQETWGRMTAAQQAAVATSVQTRSDELLASTAAKGQDTSWIKTGGQLFNDAGMPLTYIPGEVDVGGGETFDAWGALHPEIRDLEAQHTPENFQSWKNRMGYTAKIEEFGEGWSPSQSSSLFQLFDSTLRTGRSNPMMGDKFGSGGGFVDGVTIGGGAGGENGEGNGDPAIVPAGSLEVIDSTLRRWGFTTDEIGGLSGWVQQQLQAGIDVTSVLILIYDQPDFQSRFPGMKAATDAGFAPPSPDEYIEYEDGMREYIDQYLPNQATADVDTLLTTLMGGNISLLQVKQRLQIAYDQILNAPVDVKSWFLQEYGQDADAMLSTVLLDPEQSFTDLEQAAKESYTQAAASEILSNTITKDTARKIASLGYTQESQYRQFTDLAKQEFLYVEKLTERDDLRMEREGVGSAFDIDADASKSVAEREEERLSEFAGGGGAYVGTGITGFGVANA